MDWLGVLLKFCLSLVQKEPTLEVSIPFDGPTKSEVKETEPELKVFTLTRGSTIPDGIIGKLDGDDGYLAVTLERTWDDKPKVPVGTYECVLGTYRLEHMNHDIQAYCLQNVPGHTDILLHVANYTKDLNGCIGLGGSVGENMICNSQDAFDKFMGRLAGIKKIKLVVR